MEKYLLAFSIMFLGVCIVAAAWIVSQETNGDAVPVKSDGESRYELISPNENNLIIFDHETGEYWRTFIEANEGPTSWEKEYSPVEERGE
ncbi:hypothetical protein [Jeotgalibacillus terrae]|uniref:Uncharacterized protein n=1 Tax=Jeotgalibacillus terrae TaxID=587735 RepID=A0ABW5ZH12_9BACL|nr:hypothetical protein [Jeotgalibacillus terrae]MBM7578640.1 hypothetical protein [Jeotgalibacillus terrae]